MVNSVTGILFFDFADLIPHRCLRIHLGDIISPRRFLTVSDILKSLSPSNAISIRVRPWKVRPWVFRLPWVESLLRSLINVLQVSANHGLLKRFGTADVLGIDFSATSFKMEVIEDMGSSTLVMAY